MTAEEFEDAVGGYKWAYDNGEDLKAED